MTLLFKNSSVIGLTTLAQCADLCRGRFMAGEIFEDGEKIATVSKFGVLRDLDGKAVKL